MVVFEETQKVLVATQKAMGIDVIVLAYVKRHSKLKTDTVPALQQILKDDYKVYKFPARKAQHIQMLFDKNQAEFLPLVQARLLPVAAVPAALAPIPLIVPGTAHRCPHLCNISPHPSHSTPTSTSCLSG